MHTGHTIPTIPLESPAIACTLDATELADRLAEFQSLFATALRSHVREPAHLRLMLSVNPHGEAAVRDLFERESRCCQFFSFAFHREGDTLVVGIKVPEGGSPMLDEFEELARLAETTASQ
jgi:hypothetical protein